MCHGREPRFGMQVEICRDMDLSGVRPFGSGITLAAMVLMLSPALAQADWLFTPAVGSTLGRDTHGREHVIFGATAGWIDYDPPFGWEIDVSFAPDFFEGDDSAFEFEGDSHVGTLMFNGLIGDLAAIRETTGWRPFVSAGIGVIQVRVVTADLAQGGMFDSRVHEVGFNAGGGVVGFVSSRIGLRADIRYISSFEDNEASWTKGPSDFDVAPGRFDFIRGTVGVTVRFPNRDFRAP